MNKISSLFPESYEKSRERFRNNLALIQEFWPQAQHFKHQLEAEEDLSTDWIYTDALEKNAKVMVISIAEHGIEGYVGSAMQQRFLDIYLNQLNPRDTGLLLIHAINPWGMKHHRRVNANNVDLNRNFVWNENELDPGFNQDYSGIDNLLNTKTPIQNLRFSNAIFMLKLAWNNLRLGREGYMKSSLVGQYRFPRGLYFGGTEYQQETLTMIQLFRKAFTAYDQILHLDMHTGYGPRYQMSLVNSAFEKDSSKVFMQKFSYPLIVAVNPEEFYPIRGDMIDFVYALRDKEFPQKRLYAASFEFGTLGNEFFGLVHSPKAMVQENRAFWYGTRSQSVEDQVKKDFESLFNPSEEDWQRKAVADADQAFEGILKAEGFVH